MFARNRSRRRDTIRPNGTIVLPGSTRAQPSPHEPDDDNNNNDDIEELERIARARLAGHFAA
jgi:hypothetical protein